QTSNSMCESAAGVATACTRQNAGTSLYTLLPRPSGCVKAPAATTAAEVIVVSFNLSPASLSQSAAKVSEAAAKTVIASFMSFMMILLFAIDREGEQSVTRRATPSPVAGVDEHHAAGDRRTGAVHRAAFRGAVHRGKIAHCVEVENDFSIGGRI